MEELLCSTEGRGEDMGGVFCVGSREVYSLEGLGTKYTEHRYAWTYIQRISQREGTILNPSGKEQQAGFTILKPMWSLRERE